MCMTQLEHNLALDFIKPKQNTNYCKISIYFHFPIAF